jgi:hypothetical protein
MCERIRAIVLGYACIPVQKVLGRQNMRYIKYVQNISTAQNPNIVIALDKSGETQIQSAKPIDL